MAAWNRALENTIRALGDYVENQMNDLVNPKASAAMTSLRMAFRSVARGLPLMHNACVRAGRKFNGDWIGDLRALTDLAEANHSDAAAKIRKALPLASEMIESFRKEKATSILAMTRLAKKKGIQYPRSN
jgi:hypothetical protein